MKIVSMFVLVLCLSDHLFASESKKKNVRRPSQSIPTMVCKLPTGDVRGVNDAGANIPTLNATGPDSFAARYESGGNFVSVKVKIPGTQLFLSTWISFWDEEKDANGRVISRTAVLGFEDNDGKSVSDVSCKVTL
jgi:hypothetical protein